MPDYDNYDLFLMHERKVDAWLESRPICDRCGEHIQEDHLYRFDGEIYCPECFEEYIKDNFREFID